MKVASQVGRGSTFTFSATCLVGEQRRQPSAAATSLIGRRALVVDDNAPNRRVLQLQLQRWGMTSVDVATPAAALQLLAGEADFDVAVLDMHMPAWTALNSLRRSVPSRGRSGCRWCC